MSKDQELFTQFLRECPDADRFSIELSGRSPSRPYDWRVTSRTTGRAGYVFVAGRELAFGGEQMKNYLCRQLQKVIAKLDADDK